MCYLRPLVSPQFLPPARPTCCLSPWKCLLLRVRASRIVTSDSGPDTWEFIVILALGRFPTSIDEYLPSHRCVRRLGLELPQSFASFRLCAVVHFVRRFAESKTRSLTVSEETAVVLHIRS